ncbi:HAD hydrolase-like protein [Omnitrophica bacterium]|nr:HAD hydrolase-like protein [Candidatus Omnitrophota bacterium]
MDNVLIDTRFSYFDAIRWTVEIFLTNGKVPFFIPERKGGGPACLTKQQVSQFKMLGGFNDDWDCCYGLLVYILSLQISARTIGELRKKIDIPAFAKTISQYPLQVSGIVKHLGRPAGVTIEKIARIFQEVYLGPDIFAKIEKTRAAYWKKKGLMYKEKLIFRKSTLDKVKAMGIRMGIATGRPRFEAIYALDRFGILELFDSIVTTNEVKKAEKEMRQSLRKPHPYSLLQAANKLKTHQGVLYIGDLPDDILTVNRAKKNLGVQSVAFPSHSDDPKKILEEMGKVDPDYLLMKAGDLPKLLKYPNPYRFKQ